MSNYISKYSGVEIDTAIEKLQGPLSIEEGGTGSKTAEGAVANLGIREELDDINSQLNSYLINKEYGSSKIIPMPYDVLKYYDLNSLYGTSGSDNKQYFKNILRRICELYPNHSDAMWIGLLYPNSEGNGIINIYNTSIINSSTGLPQYSSGLFHSLGSSIYLFGTLDYSFYCYLITGTEV